MGSMQRHVEGERRASKRPGKCGFEVRLLNKNMPVHRKRTSAHRLAA